MPSTPENALRGGEDMIKSGNIQMYLPDCWVLFAGMSRDQANKQAREYGLALVWHGKGVAPRVELA